MPERIPIKPETLTGMFICSVDEILPEYLAPHLAMVIKNDILTDLRIQLQEYKDKGTKDEKKGPG